MLSPQLLPESSSSSIKRLHQLISQDRLNEAFVRGRVAPGLEFNLRDHGFREAVGPLLARESRYDVCDGGLRDEVWVEADIVCESKNFSQVIEQRKSRKTT